MKAIKRPTEAPVGEELAELREALAHAEQVQALHDLTGPIASDIVRDAEKGGHGNLKEIVRLRRQMLPLELQREKLARTIASLKCEIAELEAGAVDTETPKEKSQ